MRPAVSTEYIENDEPAATPTYRAYYPTRDTLRETWLRIVTNFQLQREFEDLERDVDHVLRGRRSAARRLPAARQLPDPGAGSLFFRNKGAYVVGKIINGFTETPFALPILHGEASGQLVIDAALFGEDDLLLIFSASRAPTSWSTWRCRAPTCSSCAR